VRWNLFRRPSLKAAPRLPDDLRVYAIGDLHGRADLLADTMSRVESHLRRNPVAHTQHIFLGDYVDRGPSSAAVLEQLIAYGRERDAVYLRGNHEVLLLEFLNNPSVFNEWRKYGGLETLLSYGLKPGLNPTAAEITELAEKLRQTLPPSHLEFMNGLQSSFSNGDFFFVHAGVRPGIPLDQQRDEDLLWIRDDFLLHEEDFGKVVVHGHTPVREPDFRHNRINIDTGAYATGRLTCLVIEGDRTSVLPD
jgi:serine/threonine protein phosphatase 1